MNLKVESRLPEDLEELIRDVIGSAIEVHRRLGPGFLESIYQKALCYEFDIKRTSYSYQKEVRVSYRDIYISGQRLDILVENKLILELKTIDEILPIHEAQILSYLRSTGFRAGLIINFKVRQLKSGIRRIVL
jgi:GxxExxY protein